METCFSRRHINKVTFFGGSIINDGKSEAEARVLGEGLGKGGYDLIYGGGTRKLMGIVAQSALAAGCGKVTSVFPLCFAEEKDRLIQKFGHVSKDRANKIIVDDLHERKRCMLQTDAVVVMPGGVGTLDELTEVVAVNDMASKMDNEETAIPVILVNVDDYFNYFSQLLQHMVDHGAVAPGIMKMFHVVPDASSAIEKLQELGQSEPVLAKELLTGEDLDEEKAKKVRQAPEKKVAANANMPKTLPGPQISNG